MTFIGEARAGEDACCLGGGLMILSGVPATAEDCCLRGDGSRLLTGVLVATAEDCCLGVPINGCCFAGMLLSGDTADNCCLACICDTTSTVPFQYNLTGSASPMWMSLYTMLTS